MLERRKEQRLRTYLGGTITFNRRQSIANCLIHSMSNCGAKLAVDNSVFIPDQFELHVPQRQADYRARTKWRRFSEAGVEIERLPGGLPIPIKQERRLNQLERENALLRRRLVGDVD